SAAWIAHLTGGQGVAGSNPAIPTTFLSYSYDAEKKAAMEFWHRQLTAILANKPIAAARAPTSSAPIRPSRHALHPWPRAAKAPSKPSFRRRRAPGRGTRPPRDSWRQVQLSGRSMRMPSLERSPLGSQTPPVGIFDKLGRKRDRARRLDL